MALNLEVGNPDGRYNEMERRWKLIGRLLGGTIAMRDWHEGGLPREDKEPDEQYERRLARSVLYEAFSDTVNNLTSRPYSEPLAVNGELPEPLDQLEGNADGSGLSLHSLAERSFASAIAYGQVHYLVDMPSGLTGQESLETSRQLGVRPSIVMVPATQLIGWRSESRGGRLVLTQARIVGSEEIPDGEFGTTSAMTVTVWDAPRAGERGTWRRFRRERDGFAMTASGTHGFDGVPIVTFAPGYLGHLIAKPPLEALAWLNLRHWQAYSDYCNSSRYASVSQLTATGVSEEDQERITSAGIGWARMLSSASPDARFSWTENSGTAIAALESGLRRLEERMEVLGLQPLVERSATSTATGVMASEGRRLTAIRSWIRNQEQALQYCYDIAATLTRVPLPDDFAVDIYSDFEVARGDPAAAGLVLQMYDRNLITGRQTNRQMKRYAVISDDVDVDLEIEQAGGDVPDPEPIGAPAVPVPAVP